MLLGVVGGVFKGLLLELDERRAARSHLRHVAVPLLDGAKLQHRGIGAEHVALHLALASPQPPQCAVELQPARRFAAPAWVQPCALM
jgi:hypothetical protein